MAPSIKAIKSKYDIIVSLINYMFSKENEAISNDILNVVRLTSFDVLKHGKYYITSRGIQLHRPIQGHHMVLSNYLPKPAIAKLDALLKEYEMVLAELSEVSNFLRGYSNICRNTADLLAIFDETIQRWILNQHGLELTEAPTLNSKMIDMHSKAKTMDLIRGKFYLSGIV